MRAYLIVALIGVLFGVACQPSDFSIKHEGVAVSLGLRPLATVPICSGAFVRHELDHITMNEFEPVDMYDSNGAGLAVNDLDGDGDLDVVLANLAGVNNIFWNEGGLVFRPEAMAHGSSRAVAIVDVDVDGWLDIVFTTRVGSLSYWHNEGAGLFEHGVLPGVREHAYAMAWGDLDGDGDLDLVTGSYDTALEQELRDSFMFGPGAGVFYFENVGGEFVGERLADASQALAIQLLDLNGDGRDDILVGNDFDSVRDQYWLTSGGGWVAATPFEATTQNTMSFDIGDIDNDGAWELFAADMHPMDDSLETQEKWAGVMEMMMEDGDPADPQIMENVLQARDGSGRFVNVAPTNGTAWTGWSWSSKFGDLDQDGFVDLYVVNGMATAQTFGHLPNFELVEENQVLRNDGEGGFVAMAEWGLNDPAGGRGMSMADLDGDGDLDIIINNLLAPATILENQLCEGASLLVNLHMPESQNPFAVGAVAVLHTSEGDLMRNVRVGSGYLSGDPHQLHFGFGEDVEIEGMTVMWPDGASSFVAGMGAGQVVEIVR